MKNLITYEQYIKESTVFDKDNKTPLFDDQKWYAAKDFLKIAKKSEELAPYIKDPKPRFNHGKGMYVLQQLMKRLPYKFVVRVARSAWNYGGNLVLFIRIDDSKGSTYRNSQFEFESKSSTDTPDYEFGKLFNGVIDATGKPIKPGIRYGNYKSISGIDGVVDDIVYAFTVGYKNKYGKEFNPKEAVKEMERRNAVYEDWRKIQKEAIDLYADMKRSARVFNSSIDMRQPHFNETAFRVEFKHYEPRELRHPSEYGAKPEAVKGFEEYMNAQSKLTDLLQKFADKHKIKFLHAADWN